MKAVGFVAQYAGLKNMPAGHALKLPTLSGIVCKAFINTTMQGLVHGFLELNPNPVVCSRSSCLFRCSALLVADEPDFASKLHMYPLSCAMLAFCIVISMC